MFRLGINVGRGDSNSWPSVAGELKERFYYVHADMAWSSPK